MNYRFSAALRGAAVCTFTALLVACGGSGDGDSTGSAQASAQQACDSLNGQTAGGATGITASVVAGTGTTPAYCKVSAVLPPKLNMEIRLPDQWNGKLHYGGGGGYNGSIPGLTGTSLAALKMGYANVASDSGHQGGDALNADFALNDGYAAQLFGSLSVPTVTGAAKKMLKVAYGTEPKLSYFEGCSNGGREALMAVQRAPNLFDGVIARAPAYNWTGLLAAHGRNAKQVASPGGRLTTAKIALLAKGVREACDALDGVADGIVSRPAACTSAVFNPQSLRCAGGADMGDSCLSDANLSVITSYTTPIAVGAGSNTYTNVGWPLTGNEDVTANWERWLNGSTSFDSALHFRFSDTTVKNYLARDRSVNSLTYDWNSNPGALFSLAALNDATNADIRPFRDSGAKLILWHGGADTAISPVSTAQYYTAAVAATGGQATADTFMRFYVAPGVSHCTGGAGADNVDLLSALDAWVTQKTAPATLVASKLNTAGTADLSRPLCPYPQYARYTGPANNAEAPKLASNYTCTAP